MTRRRGDTGTRRENGEVTGWGTLELDVVDDDTIVNLLGVPLGGDGLGNGDFYGPTFMPAVTVRPSETVVGSGPGGAWAEGDEVTLDLGTDCLDLPEGTEWTVDWGDGTEAVTGYSSTVSYVYTTGDGSYDVTVEAVAPDGTVLWSDFVPVAVVPAEPGDLGTGVDWMGRLTLTWSEDSALVDCFDVYVAEGDGGGGGGNFARYSAMMGQTMNGLQVEDLTADGYVLWASGIGAGERSFDLSDIGGGTHRLALVARNAGGMSAAATLTVTREGDAGTLTGGGNAHVDLGFPVNFYGWRTSDVYINASGVISFNGWENGKADQPIAEYRRQLIAPFWGSVDTRRFEGDTPGGTITYGPPPEDEPFTDPVDGQVHPTFVVHWDEVDYFDRTAEGHVSQSDTFSVYLVDRSDVGVGDFDIVFVYGDMGWDAGDLDGGYHGSGAGNPSASAARAFWTAGTGEEGTYYELPGSGVGGAMIHNGAQSVEGTEYHVAVRSSAPHLKVQDLSRAENWTTDVNKGMLGVVRDSVSPANLQMSLIFGAHDEVTNVYTYAVHDPLGGITLASLPPTGAVTYTANVDGLYRIYVRSSKDPSFVRYVGVYVQTFHIQWEGTVWSNIKFTGTDTALATDANIERQSVDIYTGQRIQLSATCGGLWTMKEEHWSGNHPWRDNFVEGFTVSADQQSGKVTPVSPSGLLGITTPSFYGVADIPGQIFQMTIQAWINQTMVTFVNWVTFNIHKPGQSKWTGPCGIAGSYPEVFKVSGDYYPIKILGGTASTDKLHGSAVWWTSTPTQADAGYEGDISYVQLIKGSNYYRANYFPVGSTPDDTKGQLWLDNYYPYPRDGGQPGTPHWRGMDEGPSILVSTFPGAATLHLTWELLDWLMWTPPGSDSIPIPIQTWKWYAMGKADWNGAWAITQWGPADPTHFDGGVTCTFPEWPHRYENSP